MAGVECAPVEGVRAARFRLGAALGREVELARRSRRRFGVEEPAVILSAHPSYPSAMAYVLKLHRDARPGVGRFMGRLENVTTGEQFVFANAAELLACLARDAARNPTHTD